MRFIANPSSKSGKGKLLWAFWKNALTETGVPFEWVETRDGAHARSLAREYAGDVVAVGGDGTINLVVNGIMSSGNHVPMGVLYAGTSPDFCRFHNIPTDPEKALRLLFRRETEFVDVLKIRFSDQRECYAACSVNIGMGADIAAFANRWRRYLGDVPGTGLGAVKSIIRHTPFDAEMTIDGAEHAFEEVNHIFIVKNPLIASGIKLDIDVKPNDGKMYVFVINRMKKTEFLKSIGRFYGGKIVKDARFFIAPCRDISIRASCVKAVEFDGDPGGETDLLVSLAPGALNLIKSRPHE